MKTLGHAIAVEGLRAPSLQPDANCLALFDLAGSGKPIDVSGCPDSMPALAALAACRPGKTCITGGARLRFKESDRIASMAEVLGALGVKTEEHSDGLTVYGGKVKGGTVSAHNDHRVAMALAMMACEAEGPVTVRGFGCVAKSRPDFLKDFDSLGGKYHEFTLR